MFSEIDIEKYWQLMRFQSPSKSALHKFSIKSTSSDDSKVLSTKDFCIGTRVNAENARKFSAFDRTLSAAIT